MQSIAHSPLTLFKPRRRNCLKPLACLICPNTGSTTCFRRRGDLLFRKPAALHSPGLLAGQTLRQNGNISGEPSAHTFFSAIRPAITAKQRGG